MRSIRVHVNNVILHYWLVAAILMVALSGCVADSSELTDAEAETAEQALKPTDGITAEQLCVTYQAVVSTGGVERGRCFASNCNSTFLGNVTNGSVHDTRADSIGIYGRFRLSSGAIIDVSDTDGSGPATGRINLNGGQFITRFECVSRDGGSSGWTWVHVNL